MDGYENYFAFQSVEHAAREYRMSHIDMQFMLGTLSGCDWCCGGGDYMMADLRDKIKAAETYLSKAGVQVTEPTVCHGCYYGPVDIPDRWGGLCQKCHDYQGGEHNKLN